MNLDDHVAAYRDAALLTAVIDQMTALLADLCAERRRRLDRMETATYQLELPLDDSAPDEDPGDLPF